MKLFVAFALLIAACCTFNITQFHQARIPQCFLHLVYSGTSKSRLACLQMCRNRCIFVEFDTKRGLCIRYQYGTTSNCAAGNTNYVNLYKKVSSYVYNIPVKKFMSWYEAQEHCISIGGCLAGNNSNLAELNLAASNQTGVQLYWIGARKLSGLGWVWLNGDKVSIPQRIDEQAATCAHVFYGNLNDIVCVENHWLPEYCICEVW